MKTIYRYLLLVTCLTLQLQATYKKQQIKNQAPQEHIELNTIVIQQKEPISTVTLGLKKITTVKLTDKKTRAKISPRTKEDLAQKAKIAKAQSLERVKEWVESRKDHPLFKGKQAYRHSSTVL